MKFKMPAKQKKHAIEVGSVYAAKGGNSSAKYFVVVAPGVTDRNSAIHLLGIDGSGQIVSTTSYGRHYIEEKTVIGKVKNIEKLDLDIEWIVDAL